MHGRGRRLVPRALVLLAVLAVLPWASAALGDNGPNPPEATTEQALAVTKTTAILHATVDPKERPVESCEFKYGTSQGSLGSTAECSPKPGSGNSPEAVSAEVVGLAPNTTYYFQVVAVNAEETGEGAEVSFKTIPNAPVATTEEAREVKLTSAVLAGTVNPEGASVTKCEFKYGTTRSFGLTAPCSPAPGSGTAPEAVTAAVTKLTPNTPYFFEVVATGEGGEEVGNVEEFKTAVSGLNVITGEAMAVTRTTAKLTGTVNPGGSPVTECEFEYGTSPGSLTSSVECSPEPGSGSAPEAVSAEITESTALRPNTTYYFRLVAENEAGTPVEGAEEHFTTLPNPPRGLHRRSVGRGPDLRDGLGDG